MKYDDASWHYGGDFPSDLPPAAGATHIGMFLTWAILQGLAGKFHLEHSPGPLEQLRQRTITPAQFLIRACGEKFTDQDLSEEGNAFAKAYFKSENRRIDYLNDYQDTLGYAGPSVYHVADTWENYDLLAPVIQKRFDDWCAKTPRR